MEERKNAHHATPTLTGGGADSVQGILQATALSAASELRSALALAATIEAGIARSGLAIRLTEPDVPPIFAHVLPLTASDFRTRLQPTAVAAVFIGAPPDAQEGADTFAAALGLTPAETKVLASLLAALHARRDRPNARHHQADRENPP